MSNRPKIPEETKRIVLFAARNHCSVCGARQSIEIAHIIPWHKSKNHDSENLIALCANCHATADKEKWAPALLRKYREHPFVLSSRDQRPISAEKNALVSLIVDMTPDELTDGERERLIGMFAAYVGVRLQEIEIISSEPWNSIRIKLLLPESAAEKLCFGFKQGDEILKSLLDDITIFSAEIESSNLDVGRSDDEHLQFDIDDWMVTFSKQVSEIIHHGDKADFDFDNREEVYSRIRLLAGYQSFKLIDRAVLDETLARIQNITANDDSVRRGYILIVLENMWQVNHEELLRSKEQTGQEESQDENYEEESSFEEEVEADDGGEPLLSEENNLATRLQKVSQVDRLTSSISSTWPARIASLIYKKISNIKDLIVVWIKKVAHFIKFISGLEFLDNLLKYVIENYPGSRIVIVSATFLDAFYRILLIVLTAFILISRPDKALRKIFGDDIGDLIPPE